MPKYAPEALRTLRTAAIEFQIRQKNEGLYKTPGGDEFFASIEDFAKKYGNQIISIQSYQDIIDFCNKELQNA